MISDILSLLSCLLLCFSPAFAQYNTSTIGYADNYNSNLSPNGKTKVWVSHNVIDISEVNDKDFSITLIVETMIGWNDNRIGINPAIFDSLSSNDSWYYMSWSEYIYLWKPFLQLEHLENRRRLHEHNQYSGGKRYAITRGDVEYSLFTQDISIITLKCAMDFNSFPFDEHTCYYEVSTGDSIEEIELVYIKRHGTRPWGEALVTTVLQYKSTFTDISDESKQRIIEHFSGYKSVVSYAGFKVKLARIPTPYLINYYLPSGLFVLVSWTSYAIPVKAIPGRVALIMTTFLSLVNIANSAFDSSPSNQGINLMQIWIISCMVMVFIAILEYFFLLWFDKFGSHLTKNPKRQWLRRKVENADRTLLHISPVIFIVYCLCYAIAVMHA